MSRTQAPGATHPMTTRREFLRTLTGLAAGAALPGCGGSDAPGAALPPESPEFDYPTVTPLPFAHGVASGDPLADRVILWTRLTEAQPSAAEIPVAWSVATDPAMTQVVKSGTQATNAGRDWTVKVDATGLSPATTYYYRFTALGAQSIVGRTRTAPADPVSEIRIAVLACSSYWSSHWSGLSHIADRNDLDLVIHCGDYIYDFVDEDETVRARRDRFDTYYVDYRDWLNLAEVRRRYALWRSDPNLLRAHQQHPWMIVWDNHDIDEGFGNELPTTVDPALATTTLDDTVRAFHEWTPTRPVKADGSGEFLFVDDGSYPAPPDPRLIWRKLAYGPLLDVFGVDTQLALHEDVSVDSSHLPGGAASLFGRVQYDWLSAQMLKSSQEGKVWRLLANQTWIAPADVPAIVNGVELPTLGLSRWVDFQQERAQLFGFLRGANPANHRVRNNIVVSGDVHGNFASDLVDSNAIVSGYVSGLPLANLRTGSTALNFPAGMGRGTSGNLGPVNLRADSVGVEFAPSSMGRGGADELVANAVPGSPAELQIAATRAIELAVVAGNRNVQFIEWVDHGYGIVHLTAERAVFEFWWQDKLTLQAPDVLGYQMVAWAQDDAAALPAPRYRDQIDAMAVHGLPIAPTSGSRVALPAPEGVLIPA